MRKLVAGLFVSLDGIICPSNPSFPTSTTRWCRSSSRIRTSRTRSCGDDAPTGSRRLLARHDRCGRPVCRPQAGRVQDPADRRMAEHNVERRRRG
jgi:hypothetical protein